MGRSLTQDPKKPKEMLPDFSIRLQNASTKEIRGLKFQAAYFDATEDLHTIPVAWNWQPNMKAGSEKTLNQENPYSDTAVVGWVVVPIKVLFADGTKWEAPESDEDMKDCFGEFWRSKNHPRLTKLPMEIVEAGKKAK